ncbi:MULTISPECIES: VOC family protein [Alloalcanivorax]|uniref:PhnB-like domain-containing protein n=1 Tax=Alloalcanivorax balearicus MACL04 TaxID=1177182 RepID=A0ABT2R040_9GAMM|nr:MULTISPECIES: VOC family protein [Alloalcanivorax]MCU5783124.1 hypothetical protein [Alloalcanivorax balearicus MACL04]WOA31840.1 VOC family protein [Alloalcanivorax xenomutans]
MAQAITPFLMFQGNAEAALRFYVSLIDDSEIISLSHYDETQPEAAGRVYQAMFRLGQQVVRCIDSPVPHDFDFTPSFSFFIDCDSEEELTSLYNHLSEQGEVMMPLDDYGFSTRFAWVADRFGVSWQLNLP